MPLVSMKEMLERAKEKQYAVGQFNLNNLEYAQAILQAAEEEQSPVILGVSEGAQRYMGGYKVVVAMVKSLMEEYGTTVPVAIHLDHGSSFEQCALAIQAGFTSVMIDGSHLPLEENIALTKKVVELAHIHGVSVEAELGRIGGEEDDVVVDDAEAFYAIPSECEQLVRETNVDCFAPALGSVHGPYKGEPNLGFDRMEEIKELTNVPLVLHGGTGIPTKDIQRAISLGSAKINVNTENQMEQTKKIREVLKEQPDLYDPRKYMGRGREAIKETVIGKMSEFGSSQQAENASEITHTTYEMRKEGEKMKFFIDTANIEEIRAANELGILAGVTTNPSLVAKEGVSFHDRLREITTEVSGSVSAEVISEDKEGMIKEGKELDAIAPNITVKVPMTMEGLKAVKAFKELDIQTNVTLIFNVNQALLAARADATDVSPFLGRLDDIGHDWMTLIQV